MLNGPTAPYSFELGPPRTVSSSHALAGAPQRAPRGGRAIRSPLWGTPAPVLPGPPGSPGSRQAALWRPLQARPGFFRRCPVRGRGRGRRLLPLALRCAQPVVAQGSPRGRFQICPEGISDQGTCTFPARAHMRGTHASPECESQSWILGGLCGARRQAVALPVGCAAVAQVGGPPCTHMLLCQRSPQTARALLSLTFLHPIYPNTDALRQSASLTAARTYPTRAMSATCGTTGWQPLGTFHSHTRRDGEACTVLCRMLAQCSSGGAGLVDVTSHGYAGAAEAVNEASLDVLVDLDG